MKRFVLVGAALAAFLAGPAAYAATPPLHPTPASCLQYANEVKSETVQSMANDMGSTASHMRVADIGAHQALQWCEKR